VTLVAGIDSSTQSCKVVVVDAATGRAVREGRAPHPEGTEVDPEAWWAAARAAVADAGGLDDVEAVSVAGQQHGLVSLDSHGRVVRPALLWNDNRSAAAARDLVDELGAARWAHEAGTVPVASLTVAKLRWLRDAEPENAARTAAVALPHDYLTWRLRGYGPERPDLDALVTDRSEASGTGYWSGASGSYRLDLLEHAFGRTVRLPRVLGPHEIAGTTGAGIAGVPPGVVVGPGAGDNAGAALGLGAAEGDAVVSIGTSGTVFGVSGRPVADVSGTVAGFADATGLHLPLIATLNAARVISAAARMLGTDLDGVASLALDAEPGAGGLVLLPYLSGERTPNLPTASGSLLGITLENATAANIARAAVEGVLCGLAEGLDAVADQGLTVERVLLIGGGSANTAVRRLAPGILGAPVTIPAEGEYVATGAARQAAWALSGALPAWQRTSTREPAPAHAAKSVRRQYSSAAARLSYPRVPADAAARSLA